MPGRLTSARVLASTIVLFGLLATVAAATPPTPCSFWGYVRGIDPALLPGAVVTVSADGISAPLDRRQINEEGLYLVNVRGDDPDTAGHEGPAPGAVLYFWVQTQRGLFRATQTGTWQAGLDTQLDLDLVPLPYVRFLPAVVSN